MLENWVEFIFRIILRKKKYTNTKIKNNEEFDPGSG